MLTRLLPSSDRRVARQTLWMGAITAVQILGGLAHLIISARILGPEGFGVLAVMIAAATLIHALMSAPGGEAVTTFVSRAVAEGRPQEAARILRFTIAMSLGLSLIAYVFIAALILTASSLLGIENDHRGVALMYGVVGILLATRTETLAALRLSDRVSLGLAIALAGVLTRVALLGVVWLQGGGMFEVVLTHIAGVAVSGLGMLAAATVSTARAGITDFLASLSLRVPPDVARFQIGIFGRHTVSALYSLDTLLLAQFTAAADVGLYRAARQVTDTGHYPFQALRNGVQLEYSKQWYSRQGGTLRRTALMSSLVSFASAAALFGLLAVFHRPIARLLLGEEFAGVSQLLLIMISGAFAANSISALAALPAAAGWVWPSVAGEMAGLTASIAVIVWLAPVRGAEGAAWANAAYFIVFAVVSIPFAISILRQSRRLRRKPQRAACKCRMESRKQ